MVFDIVLHCFCPDVSGFCAGTIVILGQTPHWISHVFASIGVRESGHSKCVYFGLQFSLAPWGHLEQTHREDLKFT